MQIDLKALELALAPIAEIGQGELTFDVGGTPITVRVLRPDEERAVQRYASTALNSEDSDPVQANEYLDRFRIATLSYAIIGVGAQRFPDFIPTGEKLDNGTPVQIERHKALRPLIEKWTREVLSGCFKKFGELVIRLDKEAEKAIVYEPSDVDAEIERMEERLKSLKREKEQANQPERNTFARQVANLATGDEQQEQAFAEAMDEMTREEEPTSAPPPVPAPQPAPAHQPQPQVQTRRQPIVPEAATPPTTSRRPVAPSEPDSFVNADDDDEMQRAVATENARLMDARRRAAAGQPVPDEGSVLRPGGPPPPHMDARAVEQETQVLEHGRRVAVDAARKIGEIGGVEAFAMPTQALDSRTPAPAPDDRMPVNPRAPAAGANNPRFRPPPKV